MGVLDKLSIKTIGLIVVVLLVLYLGFTMFFGGGDAEPEFNIEFGEDQVTVTQVDGDLVDEMSADINYIDGSTQSEDLAFGGLDEPLTIELDSSVSAILNVDILVDDEVVHSADLPDEFAPQPPQLQDIDDRTIQIDETLQVSADDFIESDLDIAEYNWALGDGNEETGETLMYSYDSAGEYAVTIEVFDIAGNSAETTFIVNVEESTELITGDANTILPDSVQTEDEFSFDASEITSNDVIGYEWDMDDGETYQTPSSTHSYSETGTYTVTLSVEDATGESDETTATIQVEEEEDEEEDDEEADETPNVNFEDQEIENDSVTVETHNSDEDHVVVITDNQDETIGTSDEVQQGDEDQDVVVTLDITLEEDQILQATQHESLVSDEDSDTVEAGDPLIYEDSEISDTATVTLPDEDEDEQDEQEESDVVAQVNADGSSAYVFDDVQPDEASERLLADDGIGSENPTLHLEEGERYRFELDDTSSEHPFEVRDSTGEALLSMDVEGSMEDDEDVDWVEEDGAVEFTATQELINQSDEYVCTIHETSMTGDIVEFEHEEDEQEEFDDEEADVSIEMDYNGDSNWLVSDYSGGDVLQNDNQGDPNPTIYLEEGLRYEFTGLTTDPFTSPHTEINIEFLDLVGEPVLSQVTEGSYEDDADVAWFDEGDTVRFTVTEELASDINGYVEPDNRSNMSGDIEIAE